MPDDLNRRTFLANLAGVGGGLLVGRGRWSGFPPVTVTAAPTVFFAQPDGKNALVRRETDLTRPVTAGGVPARVSELPLKLAS